MARRASKQDECGLVSREKRRIKQIPPPNDVTAITKKTFVT